MSEQQRKLRQIFYSVSTKIIGFIVWGLLTITGIFLFEPSRYYVPPFASLLLVVIGCIGAITWGIGIIFRRQILLLIESMVYFYLAVLSGICSLSSAMLPLPYYLGSDYHANTNKVTSAFGMAAIGATIIGTLFLRKYQQISKNEAQMPLFRKPDWKSVSHNVFQYKWLFIAPLALLFLPLLLVLVVAFDSNLPLSSNFLWVMYSEPWFLPPLVLGNFFAAVWYGGAKLKSKQGEGNFKTKLYSFGGNFLLWIAGGSYTVLFLVALLLAVYPGQ